MSHVGHINESCHTYEGVVSHITVVEHVDMNESHGTYEPVKWHTRMSCVAPIKESCHIMIVIVVSVWFVVFMLSEAHTPR